MHTISVSIYGSLKATESVEVEDGEALPLFVRLKSVLGSEEISKPARRRGRPRKETPGAADAGSDSLPETNEARDLAGI